MQNVSRVGEARAPGGERCRGDEREERGKGSGETDSTTTEEKTKGEEAKRRERKEKLETSYRVSQRGQPVAGMWVRLSPVYRGGLSL